MIGEVVLPDMTDQDWPALREKILTRIAGSMGTPPTVDRPAEFEQLRRYEAHGLGHIHIRYHVVEDHWNEAVVVLPGGHTQPAPAVLTIHGTNGEVGKFGVIDPGQTPRRAYGIELARRGYVTLSPDQFGFGASLAGKDQEELLGEFYSRWPNWSLDGMRTLEQTRAIDVLETLDYVDTSGGVGAIGNSLGGRATLHLAAMETRVAAAVPSCGLSPVCSNVYRLTGRDRLLCPAVSDQLAQDGKAVWDYHEMLALCAPRAVLLLEPFNDPYNPDIAPVLACLASARKVYELLGEAGKLAIYIHGDGHDTVASVRETAYQWLDRFLRPQ